MKDLNNQCKLWNVISRLVCRVSEVQLAQRIHHRNGQDRETNASHPGELERLQLAHRIHFSYQQCIQRTALEYFPGDCLQRIRRVSREGDTHMPFQVREKK